MKEQKKLEQLRKYAEEIQHKLESIPTNIAETEDWIPASLEDCIRDLQKSNKEIIESASSPVKLGIVGEFNAGKTLLQGSLIGYADALPISENPTTGNVTAIHLIQQEELQTTQAGNCTVEYLDKQGVIDCLNFMLQEAEKRARAAQIMPTKISLPPQSHELADILHWCETAWNTTNNLELRYLLKELVGFIRILQAYGQVLCGKTYPIDNVTAEEGLKLAEEGLKLADTKGNIQTLEFEQLPNSPQQLLNPIQKLDAELLKKSFSLIRRVKIEFKISKEIWDLSALKGAKEFIILDFPGLGAANSGVRDTFLSLQELAEVQTILILLDGRKPQSDRANQFFTIMQQHKGEKIEDRILIGIGRFDELAIINDGGEQKIDELIGHKSDDPFDNFQITEATVLEKLTVLNSTVTHAKSFTLRPDRIVFVSPILALSDLAERYSQIQVGSAKFINNLKYPEFLAQSKRLRSKWKELSRKIKESQPKSTLAKQLEDFAHDGGIGRMRELILTHVAEHGLKQLYQDTEKKLAVLHQQQEQMQQILARIEIPINDSPSLQILRQSLENLIETYRTFQRDLGKKPLPNRRGISIEQIVKEEVIFMISNWSEWKVLFNQLEQGMIPPPIEDMGIITAIFGEDPETDSDLPTKSDDFYRQFTETIRQLEKFSYCQLREAIENLLTNLSEKVAQDRKNLREILQPEITSQPIFLEKFGTSGVNLVKRLSQSDHPQDMWLNNILRLSGIVDENQTNLRTEIIFPFAKSDEKHTTGYIFPWCKQYYSPSINHQIIISRMQQEIIKCVSLNLIDLVNQHTQTINKQIVNILKFLIPRLQELSTKEELLRYIAGGEEANQVTPIWLQILSEIAQMSPPDLR